MTEHRRMYSGESIEYNCVMKHVPMRGLSQLVHLKLLQEQVEEEDWLKLVPVDGNFSKMTTIKAKKEKREFKWRECKALCLPKSVNAWWNSRDKQRTLWCANYVCCENSVRSNRKFSSGYCFGWMVWRTLTNWLQVYWKVECKLVNSRSLPVFMPAYSDHLAKICTIIAIKKTNLVYYRQHMLPSWHTNSASNGNQIRTFSKFQAKLVLIKMGV